MARLTVQHIDDGSGVCLDGIEVLTVHHDDTEIGVRHHFVRIPPRFLPYGTGRHHHDGVALEKVREADFLCYVVECHACRVLTLHLPSGKHEAAALEDEIDFRAPGHDAAEAGGNVRQVDQAHEFEGECFQGETPRVTTLDFEIGPNFLQRLAQ